MSEAVWITSIGRTGTKWLAKMLGWPHEPTKPCRKMVSPAHLFRFIKGQWNLFDDTQIVIVLRDPEAQMRSIANRWLHKPGARKIFDQNILSYCKQLEWFALRGGARVIEFEQITTDLDLLRRLAELYGARAPKESQFGKLENVLAKKDPPGFDLRRPIALMTKSYEVIRNAASKTPDPLQG